MEEFASLIAATRIYLQEKTEEGQKLYVKNKNELLTTLNLHSFPQQQHKRTEMKLTPSLPKTATRIETAKPSVEIAEASTKADPIESHPSINSKEEIATPPRESPSFSLGSPPPVASLHLETMLETMQKSMASHTLFAPSVRVVFFTFSDTQFLETVANAAESILGKYAIAVVKKKEELLRFSQCKLLVGHLEGKEFSVHEPTLLFGTIPFVPLAPLNQYPQDQALKRSLWQTLKNINSSPLLSSTLPSQNL